MEDFGRFTKKNDEFVCVNCQRNVPTSDITCRNHCPFCLTSIHVDQFPGDRANPCGGMLQPIDYELSGKKGIILVFKCKKCGEISRNIAALQGETTPDDYDLILRISLGKT